MMRRLAQLILCGGAITAAACNRPSEENCRKAILNVQSLYGTSANNPADFESQVRMCKGGATQKSVQCAIEAKTIAQLDQCNMGGVRASQPSSVPAAGSGAPGAPAAAAPGGAAAPPPASPAGSDSPAPAAGSDSPAPAAGSDSPAPAAPAPAP
ncbi:MAG: hypothetical protein AB7P03_24920 [Kofleriaceae bacterium]